MESAINTSAKRFILLIALVVEYGMGMLSAMKESQITLAIAAVTSLLLSEHIFNSVQRSNTKLLGSFVRNSTVCRVISLGLPALSIGLGWWCGLAL